MHTVIIKTINLCPGNLVLGEKRIKTFFEFVCSEYFNVRYFLSIRFI